MFGRFGNAPSCVPDIGNWCAPAFLILLNFCGVCSNVPLFIPKIEIYVLFPFFFIYYFDILFIETFFSFIDFAWLIC